MAGAIGIGIGVVFGSSSGTPPSPSNPVVGTDPVIAGTGVEGANLTIVSDGSASGFPSPTVSARQWYNAGSPIGGATGTTYTVQAGDDGDNLTLRVTWTNSGGSDTSSDSNIIVGSSGGGGFIPSLDFSDARNSQYAGII